MVLYIRRIKPMDDDVVDCANLVHSYRRVYLLKRNFPRDASLCLVRVHLDRFTVQLFALSKLLCLCQTPFIKAYSGFLPLHRILLRHPCLGLALALALAPAGQKIGTK